MEWFLGILVVAVITVAAVAGSGRLGQFGSTSTSRPDLILPNRALTSEDIHAVRFAVVPRGYAMSQVDEFLARLETQLRAEMAAVSVRADDGTALEVFEGADHDGPAEARIVGSDDAQQGRNSDGSDEATNG